MAVQVVGVDGFRGGWVAVAYDTTVRALVPSTFTSLSAVLASYPDATALGVDIPIGLSEGASRVCDVEARKVLRHRRSSVFPAPDPRLLDELDFDAANAASRLLTGKGISKQAFGIYPKVAETNRIVTRAKQDRVFEIHPEVSFWALASRPMDYPKDQPEGYEERRALLTAAFKVPIWTREEARLVAPPAKPDDLLDATVAAWTAWRVAEGRAGRLPSDPPLDGQGLRMEIVY